MANEAKQVTRKHGIEQIKKLVAFGAVFGAVALSINGMKDASFFAKVTEFGPAADEFAELFTIDLNSLRDEWHDLDRDEVEQLKALVRKDFNIPDDELEARIELWICSGWVIAQEIRTLMNASVA